MRLVLYTNMPSHYQISLGRAFEQLLPCGFRLVCWKPADAERKKLGWRDDFDEAWLIKAWISLDETRKALDLLQSADIVVWGSGPVYEVNKRVVKGKLTFRYAERLFKGGRWRLFDPRVFNAIRKEYIYSNLNSYHLLSVGPYCASDFRFIGAFKNHMWRWGYFPKVPINLCIRKSNIKPVILWAGRMVSWKRLDLLLSAASWARAHGNGDFQLRIIGFGPEEERLRAMTISLGLANICTFEGAKCPEEIQDAMDEADIYVLSSDRNEGWGVVVNEAMGHACCVIGNSNTGAIPWLIQNNFNGFTYNGSNTDDLGRILRWCLDNPERRREMGLAGRKTILDYWSPQVAAERFLRISEEEGKGSHFSYHDNGPCSLI